jgi:hypothetical protein
MGLRFIRTAGPLFEDIPYYDSPERTVMFFPAVRKAKKLCADRLGKGGKKVPKGSWNSALQFFGSQHNKTSFLCDIIFEILVDNLSIFLLR